MPNSHGSDASQQEQQRSAAGDAPDGAGHRAGDQPRDAPQQAAPAPEDLSAELARAEDRYKRALADLDNYRKRSVRDTQRRVEEVTDTLLRDWLDALDSVERALRMEPENPLLDGLRAVLSQMEAILERHGVRRVGAVGEQFDPERHEAIGVRHNPNVPDRTVIEVARSGFARGDRVLRPAQVIVSDAREPEAQERNG
jgi:molecular chaperone GrpE